MVAVIAQLATYFFTAVIYRVLLKAFDVRALPGIWDLYKVSIVSLFFNQTIPSAGISGNTYLYNYLERKHVAVSSIVSLILTELLSFYAVIEIVILVFLIGSFALKLAVVFQTVFLIGLLVYLVFGVAVVLISRKRTLHIFQKRLGKIKLIKKFLDRVSNDVNKKAVRGEPVLLVIFERGKIRSMIMVFAFQLLVFAADAFTIISLFYGLGIPTPFFFVALALIASKIISILPFSPGALILFESSMTYFFVNLGIPLGISVIVTLVYRLLSFWLPIPAGLILFRHWANKRQGS